MKWTLLTQADYLTTEWSGGKTTQLAIAPAGVRYEDRDFLWRLSSATVEAESSTFTPLPDYNRFLTVLHGSIDLTIGSDSCHLDPYQICTFDGGEAVTSQGRCTDFNLMLRKGRCRGLLRVMRLSKGECKTWTPTPNDPEAYPNHTVALYCSEGIIEASQFQVQTGELLICQEIGTVELNAKADAIVIGILIESK